jgi:hypothetical protein
VNLESPSQQREQDIPPEKSPGTGDQNGTHG